MLIGIICLTFLTLWCVCYFLFDKDLVSPAMLLLSGYTLSVTVAFFSDFTTPFTYHTETLFVLFLGTAMFLIPAYAIKRVYNPNIYCSSVNQSISHATVDIQKTILILYAVFALLVSLGLVWYYWKFLLRYDSAKPITLAIRDFRMLMILHPGTKASTELFLLFQCKKILLLTGYVFLVLYIRNVVIKRSFFSDKLLALNIFLTMVLISTDGGRAQIVGYIFSGVVLLFYYSRLYNKYEFKFSTSAVIKIFGIFLVSSIVFYLMLYMTGRLHGSFNLSKCLHHISYYLGGSIPLLDNYLTYPINSDFFGQEVFGTLLNQLKRWNLVDVPMYSFHWEFRPGVYSGNTYTALRSYIHDFGYMGLVCLPFIFSICANWLYYSTLKASREAIFLVGIVIYAQLSYKIFYDFVANRFFGMFFDVNIIPWIIGIALLLKAFEKFRWAKIKIVSSTSCQNN